MGYVTCNVGGEGDRDVNSYGSRLFQANGAAEDGPPVASPPRRPPWSLVLPRHSTFLGRAGDDWQPDAAWPITVDGLAWIVPLTSPEAPGARGTLTVDAATCIITMAELGRQLQTLVIDRTEPAEEDLAALASLRDIVKRFR